MNRSPPPRVLKSSKRGKNSSKAAASTVDPTIQTPEPRKRLPSVTPSPPSAIDKVPREDNHDDDDSTLPEDLFTSVQDQDTSHQDAVADAVREEVDALIATGNMSPTNRGNATTTISKSELEALLSDKKALDSQLGLQLGNVKKLQAELKTTKDQLMDILTKDKDEYNLDLHEKYETLCNKHKEYLEKTEASLKELEELKSKKVPELNDKEIKALQNKSSELTKTKATLAKANKDLAKTKEILETTRRSVKAATAQNKSLNSAISKLKEDLAKAKEDLKTSNKQVQSLEKKLASVAEDDDVEEEEGEDKHSKAYYKNMVSQLTELKKKDDKEYNELIDKYDNCKDRLDQCYEALKAKNLAIPAEECGDIRDAARAYLKDVVFRTHRLTSSSNSEQVKALMKKVYDGIKKEMGFEEEGPDKLPFKEFHRIYQKKLMEYYSGLRSNVQSACKAAIMGKFSGRKSYMSRSQV